MLCVIHGVAKSRTPRNCLSRGHLGAGGVWKPQAPARYHTGGAGGESFANNSQQRSITEVALP